MRATMKLWAPLRHLLDLSKGGPFYAALLASLAGCMNADLPSAPQEATVRATVVASSPTVTALPSTVSPGDSVSVTTMFSTSQKTVYYLKVAVLDPEGLVIWSSAIQRQGAGKALAVTQALQLKADARDGAYAVRVQITTDQNVIYSADRAAGFAVRRPSAYVVSRLASPARSVVSDARGNWVATFTDGASTVTLAGARRTFAKPGGTAFTVSHSMWVRVLPRPFVGTVDEQWLTQSLTNPSPDILALAMKYVQDAPDVLSSSGLRIAGDADYGPLLSDGSREAGADFNDYLGIAWTYPDGTVRQPRSKFLGSLDCTGFAQMVFGYRGGMPLAFYPDGKGVPRTARDMYSGGPGIIVERDAGVQLKNFSSLAVGDIVLFDAKSDPDAMIDHTGIYLGVDSGGHYRFISSRGSANGPTMGDVGSRSYLDGSGYYAAGFRAVRRM